jgi:hypothetical protein
MACPPREEKRARRLVAELDSSWQVLRPGPIGDVAKLRAMADAAGQVVHLDTSR